MSNYQKLRRYDSDVHVYTFDPDVNRFDVSIGVRYTNEKLSDIDGEPTENEWAIAKLNGGFFNTDNSKEYIGSFVDEGLYYNPSSDKIPTFILWNDNTMTVEQNPIQSRHAYYQQHAKFAIGLPWALVLDGKENFLYDINTLISKFGHPTQKHPRTLVGQKEDKTIVLVAVDGRSTTNAGIDIYQSAELMLELGCVIAGNCDGGGSTEMIVNDIIANNPSDGAERRIGTSFIVYGPRPEVTGRGEVISCSTLNIRKGMGTTFTKVGTLPVGSEVDICAKVGDWYQLIFDGKPRYAHGAYIKLLEEVEETTPPSTDEEESTNTDGSTDTETEIDIDEYTKVNPTDSIIIRCISDSLYGLKTVSSPKDVQVPNGSLLQLRYTTQNFVAVKLNDEDFLLSKSDSKKYVSIRYVETEKQSYFETVSGKNSYIRSLPNTSAPIIISFPVGVKIRIYSTSINDYYMCEYNGCIGWIPYTHINI